MNEEASRTIHNQKDRSKILLVGLANAGKTSIYLRCFEKADHERIRNLTPTILFTSNVPKIDFTEEYITFVDLGGQKQYIKHHLSDPLRFKNLRTVIFVVDVQDLARIEEVKGYFSQVLERIQKTKENPVMSVFLHKVDPKQKVTLQSNILEFIKELIAFFPPNITFHTTSIFDDSVYEAIIQTLFLSLPKSVIEQTIVKDILYTAHKALIPIFRSLNAPPFGNSVPSQEALRAFAIPFGKALGKNLNAKWIEWIMTEDPSQVGPLDPNEEIFVHSQETGFVVELKCPLDFDLGLKPQAFHCDITHGILKGLATLLGFDTVTQIKTRIKHNVPVCKFQMIRK